MRFAGTVMSAACLLGVAACGPMLDEQQSVAPDEAASVSSALVVGSVNLSKCSNKVTYYCGTLARPLDPAGGVTGSINIHYEWFPHTKATPALGTILAIEGGPGYASTASRDYYLQTFPTIFGDWDMLLVDARGTGQSGVINCPAIQAAQVVSQSDVAACGTTLGNKSDLYGTDLAADDTAAILTALGVSKVDVFGDSYGTFSAQVFAGRHPTMVRTIVLDAAYPALSNDGWYAAVTPGLVSSFNNVCSRSPDCSGLSSDRLGQLLTALRASPSTQPTVTRGTSSGPMAPGDIAFAMYTAGSDWTVYTELDSAIRAFLAGDKLALVRLVNEAYANESGAVGAAAADYSMGMFAATSCSDNPTVFDRTLPPAQRLTDYQAAVAREKVSNPNVYAPFSIDEWLTTPLDWGQVPLCLNWPVASAAHPAGRPIPSGVMPNVPALVLTGDLDTVTPVGEGDQAAAEFVNATRLIVPNGAHVTAEGDANYSGCLSTIVSDFIKNNGTANTSCAATALAPMRLVPNFPTTLADVSLRGVTGNTTAANLRIARAAVLGANDSFLRWYNLYLTSGTGLRGGTWKTDNRQTKITLTNAKWVSDLTVSGPVAPNATTGVVTATLTLSGGPTGKLTAVWDPFGAQANITVTGTINGANVSVTMPAP